MSQHPSLSSIKKHKRHRSILKRYERLKHMKEKGIWDEEKSSVFGLPKIKILKFKVKKEKAVEEVPAAEAEVPAAEEKATTQPASEAKESKGKDGKEKDISKK